MDELIEFFNARMAADQKYGEACLQSHSRTWVEVGHRTLREVEAKRQILALCDLPTNDEGQPVFCGGYGEAYWDVVQILVATYSDYPGYQPEWVPDE